MLMAGFQPGSRYSVGSDHSATTNVQFLIFLIAYFFYKGNINVWAFSKVYYIPFQTLPAKLLNKHFLSITQPMTQAFLEDAHKS